MGLCVHAWHHVGLPLDMTGLLNPKNGVVGSKPGGHHVNKLGIKRWSRWRVFSTVAIDLCLLCYLLLPLFS